MACLFDRDVVIMPQKLYTMYQMITLLITFSHLWTVFCIRAVPK